MIAALLSILAVALQIQLSFFAGPDYMGLRLNLADLILPFTGLWVLFSLLSKRSIWPVWSVGFVWVWVAGLMGVMSLALVNGYLYNGFLSNWAFINKYIGFFVLLSYFALGGWLVTNAGRINVLYIFLRVFCGFYIAVLVASFLAVLIQPFIDFPLWIGNYNWDGLMANRNAFLVVTIFVMIFLETMRSSEKPIFPAWVYTIFWTLMPIFALYNTSRTGWIFAAIFLPALFILRPRISLKTILPFLLLGSLIAFGTLHSISKGEVTQGRQFKYLVQMVHDFDPSYGGDKNRLIALEDGWELYSKSNPLLGAGLGTFREYQTKKRGEFLDIVDFTALWLLMETGAIGLVAFAGFFVVCLVILYKKGFGDGGVDFHRALFFFLLAFAFLSCLHEIMYSRFLWFALGLGLARSRT